jgi:ABC-type transport system involved in multi-copper enzyme maturation permease subunit
MPGNRGFGYEFRRTLLRPSLLAAILVGGLVAIASGAQVAAAGATLSREFSGVALYDEGAYNFDFFAFNEYGSGLSDVPFSVMVTQSAGTAAIANLSGQTGFNGSLQLSVPMAQGTYEAFVTAGPPGDGDYWSGDVNSGQVDIGSLAPGKIIPLLSPIVSPLVLPVGFSGQPGLQVFYPGAIGAIGQAPEVYYAIGYARVSESNSTRLGTLITSHQFFPLVLSSPPYSSSAPVMVEIFAANGSLLAADSSSSVSDYSLANTVKLAPNSAFIGSYWTDMTEFLPILAVVVAIAAYGRDRSSGVLESTLVRPITPLGLAVSRLLAVTAAMLLSVGVGTLVIDLLIHHTVGYYVLPSFLIAFALGSAVLVGFFIGTMFALSYAFRSLLTAFGVGLGLCFLFDVFWDGLRAEILSSPNAPPSLYLTLSFYNPIQYASLVWSALTNSGPLGYGVYVTAASYGVGPWNVGLAAAGWALIPTALLVALVRTRD